MEFHYTWQFGRHFAPLLRLLRQGGFFEAPVYLFVMTIPAIALFLWVFKKVRRNDGIRAENKALRSVWHSFYFFICWMAMNTLAVGFKTMIVEELDYQERKWFEPYLPGIHFYITSASLAYIALIVKPRLHYSDLILALYLQVALIAGYGAAVYRAFGEDIEGATGGLILLIFFSVCNYDLVMRARRSFSASDSPPYLTAYLLIILSLIVAFSLAFSRHSPQRFGVEASNDEAGKTAEGIGISRIEPEMIRIPAGEFLIGNNDLGCAERPVHSVYLNEYYIARFEVTNAEYKAFCDASGRPYPQAPATDDSIDGTPSYLAKRPDSPVGNVNWDDAVAYCEWLSRKTGRKYRLPTEAEWEKAARGGLEGKNYPWGDQEYDAGGRYRANCGSEADNDRTRERDGFLYAAPVGSFSPNGYGLYDTAGNLWEWCADIYDETFYSRSPDKNPRGADIGEKRVIRGGSWFGGPKHMQCAARLWNYPSIRYASTGFRLSMTP